MKKEYSAADMRKAAVDAGEFVALRSTTNVTDQQVEAWASKRWPDPVRPRIVEDPHMNPGGPLLWKVMHGNLYARVCADWVQIDSVRWGEFCITRERITLWADLLNSPTEPDLGEQSNG